MKTFKLVDVNDVEVKEAQKLVKQWMRDGGDVLFSSSKGTARRAITEFILNQKGSTGYESRLRKAKMRKK